MMLSQVGPEGVTPPTTRAPNRWGPAGTMGLASGCALPGDGIAYSSSSCVFVCCVVCVSVCVLCVCVYLFVCLLCVIFHASDVETETVGGLGTS